MKTSVIRKRFIDYFVKVLDKKGVGHVEVPSSPLVPERHPTLLFVNSGMVQFTPYFLGEKDPVEDFGSPRLCSVQKSLRTGDLDIVGKSKYHLTFFEMMGSWSIGDYGKGKAVEYAYDLLTNKDYGYGLDPSKFVPTVFVGSDEVECDNETIEAWKLAGIADNNISRLPASENWWAPAGFTGPGPCGPCTEVLYDRGAKFGRKEKTPGLTDNPRYIEIWNAGVFIQYARDENGKLRKLDKMSVDTGAGLERFAVLLQGVDSVYETDLFVEMANNIKSLAPKDSIDDKSPEVIEGLRRSIDHLRASVFIAAENVVPSNKDQGYVLRKMIRRVFNDFTWKLQIEPERMTELVPGIISLYKDTYPEIDNEKLIIEILLTEIEKTKGLEKNTRKFMKKNKNAFDIYQSTGGSRELIENIAEGEGVEIDFSDFEQRIEEHKKLSQKGAGKKFKGGLGDYSEQTIRLHTATHLLHWALREVLGDGVVQKGSNITAERLRFDFSYGEKLTEQESGRVEELVNEKIDAGIPIASVILPKAKAEKTGAIHAFGEKYGEKVKIYYIGKDLDSAFSKEFCGGPHVSNTSDIGRVRITKQKKIGSGLIRVYAETV